MGANRGASGIDGVLSSAAGFAEGLGRGTTLVVGDVSFLHDVNGLNLLRTSAARPPLTVRAARVPPLLLASGRHVQSYALDKPLCLLLSASAAVAGPSGHEC